LHNSGHSFISHLERDLHQKLALTDHVPDLQILKQIYDDVSNDRPIMKHK